MTMTQEIGAIFMGATSDGQVYIDVRTPNGRRIGLKFINHCQAKVLGQRLVMASGEAQRIAHALLPKRGRRSAMETVEEIDNAIQGGRFDR